MTTDMPAQSLGSRIMAFTPSKEEFRDFSRYIAYMESQGAHKAGMAKVIPPKGWKPRRTYDDIDDLVIPAPIQQVVTGQSGLFTQYNIQKKPMTVHEFRKTSNMDKFCNPRYVDFEELERKFWKNLTFNPPLYGADVSGTLYDPDVTEWNIGRLNTILDTVENESGIKIKGVNTPYLYFGMWKSAFAWHTEDMDLYSINYLHFGEPKSWYVVPPEHGKRLERLAKGFFPGNAQSCEAFLRHKMTLISPSILKKYGIPFEKVTQEAGQFIVTFPFGYHAGFNHGFNCAESTNFATQRWIDYGKQATLCSCRQDMVKISMDVFVRRFQPDRYKLWKAGKDNTPIDHSKPTPEAAEFLKEDKTEPSKESPSEAGSEEPTTPVQEDKSPKPQAGTKRQLDAIEASEDIKPELTVKETEEVEPQKAKLSRKESLTKVPVKPEKDADKVTAEPKKEKDAKTQTKSQSKASTKKTSNRRSPSKKEKYSVSAADVCPPEPVESQVVALCSEEAGSSEEPQLGSSCSPAHKLFQRTLSPADVLHVHSYAKGDYAEGEALPKEEKKSEGSDNEMEKDNRHFSKAQVAEEVAADGQPESDLGQLPGHHPLLKDGMSDEEAQESPPVEEGGLEGESWAKPLAHLWQSRPPNLKKEKEYNQHMGSKPPYCSICMLFHTYQQTECANSVDSPVVVAGGRMRTKPLIPEMCFTTTTEEDSECEEQPVTPHLEEDGTSLLISCSQCSVRFHTSCYGVDPASVSKEWKCARCKANAMTENCCLCSLRGGALQKANNNKWVHVLCAVAVLEARFVNITERSPVDLSGIPLQRFKLSRDCAQLGPPPQGEVVQVRWTDGLVYGAKFVAAHAIHMYLVEFEDGSQLTTKRDDVYALDEELPKRVKSRLSKASDMRFDGIFEEKEIIQESKRQRVINSRYRGDYIEPVIYRAIME
ncbi:lysine-specific demethylase 4A isoform X3 [Siniperca chuatsi]|uniref:lysine-specific demethylase 4A isoform X3 n=1 Tax=Siniperca chuatsi TaxID=119488 RepID=UPI001CE16DE5|nr:lysine-specific demethylase 4A isoform X3 [Siniperca chuatsi]